MSLLLPSLNRAREKGRAIVCANNQKQIGLSIALYQNDNKGKFPYAAHGNVSFDDLLASYLGVHLTNAEIQEAPLQSKIITTNMFKCPSSTVVMRPNFQKRSYVMNGAGATHGNFQGVATDINGYRVPTDSIFIHQIEDTSNMIVLASRDNTESAIGHRRSGFITRLKHVVGTGHFGKYNFLFADSHVELMQKYDTLMMWRRDDTAMWE